MSRMIDADAFRRELDNHWPFTRDEQSKHGIADVAKSVVLFVLNKMPTIEERKTGRWGAQGECPFCGYLRQWEDDKFCGNCGAKMEGEG